MSENVHVLIKDRKPPPEVRVCSLIGHPDHVGHVTGGQSVLVVLPSMASVSLSKKRTK